MINFKKAYTDCEDCWSATYSKCKKCLVRIAEIMKSEESLNVREKKSVNVSKSKPSLIIEVKNNYQRYLENKSQMRSNENTYVRKVSYDVNPIEEAKFERWNSKIVKALRKSSQGGKRLGNY